MASGAGVNTVGNKGGLLLLTVPPGASTPISVSSPQSAYGSNNGQTNNPWVATSGTDSGIVLVEAKGFTKWTFQIIGPGVGATGTAAFNISIYGTVDPALLSQAYATPGSISAGNVNPAQNQPNLLVGQQPNLQNSVTALPASSWSLLPMQASTGGGTEANPLVTGTNTIAFCSGALVAVRAVLTGTAPTTGTAPITVIGFAAP